MSRIEMLSRAISISDVAVKVVKDFYEKGIYDMTTYPTKGHWCKMTDVYWTEDDLERYLDALEEQENED